MTNAQPGWYPDPAGDPTRLRYYDGFAWTDQYTPNPQASPQQPNAAYAAQQAQQSNAAYAAAAQQPGGAHTAQQTDPNAAYAAQQPNAAYVSQQPGVAYAAQQPNAVYTTQQTTTTTYGPVVTVVGDAIYPMTETDRTLRLIAFILNLLTTIACGVFIITLAWMIPMTVHSWGIYKGKKPNTVAFGVCDLLFLGVIPGILLLCSKKDA